MSNVFYTSCGFSSKYSDSDWSKIQKEKINQYCSNNNISLEEIDYDNKYMLKILNNFEPHKDKYNKTDITYSLSSIASIYDFVEKKQHSNFFWMHLDMAIKEMDKNIFDFMCLKDNEIYSWNVMRKNDYRHKNQNGELNISDWHKKKLYWLDFLFQESDFETDLYGEDFITCNSSIIALNINAATKFVDILNSYCNIFEDGFQISSAIVDENILEFVDLVAKKTHKDLKLKSNVDAAKKEYYNIPISYYDDYSIFIHFNGDNKEKIPSFYKDIQ